MTDHAWTGSERAALRYMTASRRRFLGMSSWVENLTAEDRELRPVYIDTHIAVLRTIAAAFPDRAGQVASLIAQIEAAKGGRSIPRATSPKA